MPAGRSKRTDQLNVAPPRLGQRKTAKRPSTATVSAKRYCVASEAQTNKVKASAHGRLLSVSATHRA